VSAILRLSFTVTAVLLTALLPLQAPVHGEDGMDMQVLIAANSTFATDLYTQLKSQKGNLFFSPYSISAALAMTYAGARATTAKQISEVLQFTMEQKRLHRAFGELMSELNAVQEKGHVELRIANALWAEKNYHLLDSFLDVVTECYRAKVSYADFRTAYEVAREEINAWVEHQTNDKITELLKPGVLDPLTRLILINAIYFKGRWANQFAKRATRVAAFWVTSDTSVDVPMMSHESEFNYAETDTMQILELPYAGNDLFMIILLPKAIDGLARLEASLSAENLNAWLGQLNKQKVKVLMPRFEMTSQFSLERVLASMGMLDAFDLNRADFSGMDGTKMLYISAIVHKAFVEVNEEGTEAAAATGVVIGLKSVPQPPRAFRADHPFIFFIRDNRSESILFIGRVIDPTR